MANFEVDKIRNIAVIAHGGAGKTSLVEAMLFDSGAIDRLGNVQDGTTTTDFEPEEIERKITISSSLAFCSWKGCKLNLLDTPGFINFLEDTRGCLRAADGAIVIVSAISGVKGNPEMWKYASEFELRGLFLSINWIRIPQTSQELLERSKKHLKRRHCLFRYR
jgi:elongation factor G